MLRDAAARNGRPIIAPNLNAEFYRNFIPSEDFISGSDYIRIHSDGGVLIGSSEHVHRYLNGQACVYKSVSEAYLQHKNYNRKRISLDSGTNDGCFIVTSEKVFLLEDSGAVSVWSKDDGQNAWYDWIKDISVAQHDDAALVVDCLSPGKNYITAGADGNIKVWDISTLICAKNYETTPRRPIYGLATRPESNTYFASGSMNYNLNLWGENTDEPQLEMAVSDCCIRCLTWISENQIVFGNEAGILSLVDIRNPKTVTKLTEFPAAVHRVYVNSDCSKLAVCCDNTIVSVCEITPEINCKVGYHDRHLHTKFVRGLAWDHENKNVLHSVGWDGEIKKHQIA